MEIRNTSLKYIICKEKKFTLTITKRHLEKLGCLLWNRQGAYRLFHRALLVNQITDGVCVKELTIYDMKLNWSDGKVISNEIAATLIGD